MRSLLKIVDLLMDFLLLMDGPVGDWIILIAESMWTLTQPSGNYSALLKFLGVSTTFLYSFSIWSLKVCLFIVGFLLPMSFRFLKQLFQESWINTVNIVVHVDNSRTQEAKAGSEVQAKLTTASDCVSEKEDNTLTVLVLAWPLLPLLPPCLVQRIAG